jgi:hypothetical protein
MSENPKFNADLEWDSFKNINKVLSFHTQMSEMYRAGFIPRFPSPFQPATYCCIDTLYGSTAAHLLDAKGRTVQYHPPPAIEPSDPSSFHIRERYLSSGE